ncbi:MAG TPA: FAD-binding oxidoreductase [Steroidobacteraceae bacterium]|nr:FAD-binding oxidoreductase [Steroidobacteraceae bacterium]
MAFLRQVSSYYLATAHPAEPRPQLAGDVDCDVCVVGGGIAGCSTALHLAERGYRVVLVEEHRIGWGASGRSGGQVLPGTAAGPLEIERLAGLNVARQVWNISVEGVDLVRSLIARHAIDCNWVSGHMQVAITPRHDGELRAIARDLPERFGYSTARYMPLEEVRSILDTKRYIAALFDERGGHLHPLNYTLGLAAAAERRGARIFEGTRALEFERHTPAGAALSVRTARGTVRCSQLALCGNAHLGRTARELASKIMAVGTCVITTGPLGPQRARRLITNNAAVSDMNWVLDYFRRTADDRLLFGGRVTYSGFDPSRIAATTRRRLVNVFPQLADAKVEHAWGGYLDITMNRAPHFGRLGRNVYFLQGFSGHGIALAGIAGKLLAEAVAGQAERFDVFARIPHRDFPGGALLRRPALVLAMLYYRIKDLLS